MNGMQCRMARAALELGIRETAARAQVAASTLQRIERGEDVTVSRLTAVREALEAAGATFLPDDGNGPGVRVRPSGTETG